MRNVMNSGTLTNPVWIDMDTLENIDGKSYSIGYEDGFEIGEQSNTFRWNVATFILLVVSALLGFVFGMGCQ